MEGRAWGRGGAMHPKGACSASLHCVGIAPYGRFIEGAVVGWREGQNPAPTGNTMLYICGNYGLK